MCKHTSSSWPAGRGCPGFTPVPAARAEKMLLQRLQRTGHASQTAPSRHRARSAQSCVFAPAVRTPPLPPPSLSPSLASKPRLFYVGTAAQLTSAWGVAAAQGDRGAGLGQRSVRGERHGKGGHVTAARPPHARTPARTRMLRLSHARPWPRRLPRMHRGQLLCGLCVHPDACACTHRLHACTAQCGRAVGPLHIHASPTHSLPPGAPLRASATSTHANALARPRRRGHEPRQGPVRGQVCRWQRASAHHLKGARGGTPRHVGRSLCP